MIDRALNMKLAKWAGFEEANIKKHYYWEYGGRFAKWIEPQANGYYQCHMKLPNFTDYLNACYKWLVPIITKQGCLVGISMTEHFCEATIITDKSLWKYMDYNNEPALALCKVIEQLIDSNKGGE